MPETKHFYTNGAMMKSIALPQYPDSAWEWITGAPENKDIDLYSRVAAVYRCANLTADALSNMPFAILRGDQEFDTSDDWQNKIGFMKNPRELLRLWRLSIFMTNSAYGFMEGPANRRKVTNLRYLVPTTITPEADREGLKGFKRQLGNESTFYSLEDNRIFYIFKLDHTTELLPSKHTEFKALMAAAGVLFYADYYIQNFFQRGGVKPALLSVAGVPTPAEREKIESVWDKIVHGWYKYTGKVISAETMDVKVIGDGIDNLNKSDLHDEKLSDIAMAAGMPLSLLLANSANYATARTEYEMWFRDKIVPDSHIIAASMNELLFEPLGLHFEFRPEESEHGQEEEKARAYAYQMYVNSGMRPSVVAQMLGLDLPPDVEYESLDEGWLPKSEMMPQFGAPEPKPDADTARQIRQEQQETQEDVKSVEPTMLTLPQLRELENWQDLAFRKLKRGDDLNFTWVCKEVPETIASAIRYRLPYCKSREDIEQAFQMSGRDDDAILALTDALNKAVERLEV